MSSQDPGLSFVKILVLHGALMFYHVLSILQRVNSPKPSEAFCIPDAGEKPSGDDHAEESLPPASDTVQRLVFFSHDF